MVALIFPRRVLPFLLFTCIAVLLRPALGSAQAPPSGITITNLGTLGGRESVALDINNHGQVVGRSHTTAGNWHAFLWQNGTTTDLGTLGTFYGTSAIAINEQGQVVGVLQAAGASRAFLWQNGTMTALGTLGGNLGIAFDINEQGQVVGSSTAADEGSPHAFVWQNGTMTDLGTLGGKNSVAEAINEQGQVVGSSRTAERDFRAVLWTLPRTPTSTPTATPGVNRFLWKRISCPTSLDRGAVSPLGP